MAMSLAALAFRSSVSAPFSGISKRRGEVVHLDPLLEEVGVIPRHLVAEHHVAQRLQRQRPRVVLARIGLRQVDRPVRQIGDRPRRLRAGWRCAPARSPRCAGHPVDHGPGDRPFAVADRVQQAGGDLLDVAEVVVLIAHPLPQLRVRPPRVLRGRRPLGLHRRQRPVQRRPAPPAPRSAAADPGRTAGMPQRVERVGALGLLELDLQRRAPARGRPPPADRASPVPSAAAIAVSTDSFASRLPFSINDSADAEMPAAAATSSSVRPAADAGAGSAGRPSAGPGRRGLPATPVRPAPGRVTRRSRQRRRSAVSGIAAR